MVPGDLVRSMCFLYLHSSADSVNRGVPDDGVPMNSTGILITPPNPRINGNWVKWMVNGKVGWSNFTLMEVIW